MRAHYLQHVPFEGPGSIGLQFHLETTPEAAREIVAHCRAELRPTAHLQSETALLAAPPGKHLAINHLMDRVLAFLVDGIGQGGNRAAFLHRRPA